MQLTPSRKPRYIAVLSVLLVLSLIFGVWAFLGRQDYKNKSDAKVAAATAATKTSQAAADKTYYTNLAKQPYKTFTGPTSYGTITFSYPKNWSAYVDQTNANEPIDGYFFPDVVPGITSDVAFPLRVELLASDYTQVVGQYDSQVTEGSITSSAYMPPKMAGVTNAQAGVRLDGAIGQAADGTALNGSMVILKVRDKTLQIYTQTTDSLQDFNDVVLASLSYSP